MKKEAKEIKEEGKGIGREALFYKKLANLDVQCQLCPHFCVIKPGEVGKCRARENQQDKQGYGRLVTLVYNKPCSLAVDPIEKKPLYHFLPGERAFSIATAGCNLACEQCQNFEISQAKPGEIPFTFMHASEIVAEAIKTDCKIIAYTFTEPSIFYEYMIDIAKLAKKQNIKNTTVTNGFINPEPLNQLCYYLDGSNIDLKSMSDKFYKDVCGARLQPVLDAIKIMHEKGIWIELTNLIIPGYNDSLNEIRKLVSWILNNLNKDVPLHFTAFYPVYKLSHVPPTPLDILKKARKIAMDAGLNFVYTGNLPDSEGNNTYCPKCKELVIARQGFNVIENKLKKGKCRCGEKIAGVWE